MLKKWMKENQLYENIPPNFRICARRNVPAKRFKICHILYILKPKVLKHFTGTFRRAQTLKLGGVTIDTFFPSCFLNT